MKENQEIKNFTLPVIEILGISIVGDLINSNSISNLSKEDREEITKSTKQAKDALESKDYFEWSSLVNERISRIQKLLTKEYFQVIVGRQENNSKLESKLDNPQKVLNHFIKEQNGS